MYVSTSYTVQLSKDEHELLWEKNVYLAILLHDRNPKFVKRFAPAVFEGLNRDLALEVKRFFGDTSDVPR